jgi:proteasome lid subunit RPN8/RPN11
MEVRMLALIALLSLGVGGTLAAQPGELAHDPVVRDFCRMLLEKAVSERSREQGAFVVRTKEGHLYFVTWPPSEEMDRLRWHGSFPKGTVAIVHTHPSWIRDASKLDILAARRSRIPVYVITRTMISKTTGDGSVVVVEGDWARRDGRDSAVAEPLRAGY